MKIKQTPSGKQIAEQMRKDKQDADNLASELGFTKDMSDKKGTTYRKGNLTVWSLGFDDWQTAELTDNRYKNHKRFSGYKNALTRWEN